VSDTGGGLRSCWRLQGWPAASSRWQH